MRLRSLLPSLVLLAASSLAPAATPVAVDVDEANPPFMFSQGGHPAGIYPAILEAAFKHMNVPLVIQTRPWKRAIQDIDAGTAGVGGIYKNADRETKYDFSDKIFVEKLVVYFNKTAPVKFDKIDDLKGKKVGVIRGWSYGDDFDNARNAKAFTAEETDGDESNFKKLDLGRLDAAVAVSESGAALLPKYKNVAAAAIYLSQNPTYLAMAKSAHQSALLKEFDQAVSQMQKSGEFKNLVAAALK